MLRWNRRALQSGAGASESLAPMSDVVKDHVVTGPLTPISGTWLVSFTFLDPHEFFFNYAT